jgi:hypothetical protein
VVTTSPQIVATGHQLTELDGLSHRRIGRVSPDEAMGRVWPYLAAVFVALIIVVLIAWLSIGFL